MNLKAEIVLRRGSLNEIMISLCIISCYYMPFHYKPYGFPENTLKHDIIIVNILTGMCIILLDICNIRIFKYGQKTNWQINNNAVSKNVDCSHPSSAPIYVNNIMSTMVVVTIALTLPCVMLVESPSNEYDPGWLSVASGVRDPLMLNPVELAIKILHPFNQHYRRSLEVDDTRTVHPTDNGSNYSQIYKFNQSSSQTVLLDPEKNFSTNLQDSIHDMSDKDLEETEITNEENGWSMLFKPEQSFISNITSSEKIESVSGSSRPYFEIGVLNLPSNYDKDRLDPLNRQVSTPSDLNTYYDPLIGLYYGTGPVIFSNSEMPPLVSGPNTNLPIPNIKPEIIISPESLTNLQEPIAINPALSNVMSVKIPTASSEQYSIKLSNLNWRRVSLLLAFIKLGLIKLKSMSLIKILFFFLFKLKLFLILIFFKTISIFNILLFSKLFVIPLFLLPLLPIIVSMISPKFMVGLLSIPGKIMKYNIVLDPAYVDKFTPASTSATETNSFPIHA